MRSTNSHNAWPLLPLLFCILCQVGHNWRVKLSNIGEGRSLDLDETELSRPAGSYVYLPKNVLGGQLYTSTSDIYSLGILIWEVWHDQEILVEQRKRLLRDFIELPDPCLTRMGDIQVNETSTKIGHVVQQCMSPDKAKLSIYSFQKLWESTMIELKVV